MTDITLEQLALLPCPFCGGEAKRDDRSEYQGYSAAESQSMGMGVSAGGFSRTTYAIKCECGIRVEGNNDNFLVARWNRRPEAALRLSAGADWQPIETAPKDRTDILIAGGTYSVGDYHDLKFSGVGIAFWDRDHWHGNEENAHDEWCRHQPTHWQPIPAAPRHETGEVES